MAETNAKSFGWDVVRMLGLRELWRGLLDRMERFRLEKTLL